MAQHDYVIDNASGAAVRADLNNALSAIATQNSGATAPSTTYAHMFWPDTTTGLLKQRNSANTAWVTVGTLGAVNLGLIATPGAGTTDYVLATDGAGTYSWVYRQQFATGTSQATTSGTSFDFTSLPTWVKAITVMFSGVSTSGTSNLLVQLGTASGVISTGYASGADSTAGQATATNGFLVTGSLTATAVTSGTVTIRNVTGTTWVASAVTGNSVTAGASMGGGNVALAAALTRLRVTTVNGTDTFDAGAVNIMYEG